MKKLAYLACLTAAACLAWTGTAQAGFDYCHNSPISADRVSRMVCLNMQDITKTPTNQACVDKFKECRTFFTEKLESTLDYHSQGSDPVFTPTSENEYSGPNPYKVEDEERCVNLVHGEFLGSGMYYDKHADKPRQDMTQSFDKYKAELKDVCDPAKMAAAPAANSTAPSEPAQPKTISDSAATAQASPASGGCSLGTSVTDLNWAMLAMLAAPLLRKRKA